LSAAGEASPATPFGDRLAGAVAERESQIVLGIDPDPAKLWPGAVEELAESRARLTVALADVGG
jgi:orotidine-5'-phosphate decarboxylase